MKVGDPVEVTARWSMFRGKRGHVTQLEPYVAVLLEGERLPLRLDDSSLRVVGAIDGEPNLTGAE